ncbi:MAG: MATE family efflux transporter [Microscillaceae bacterium]|nr:MATE family efflux transporter [Microscillaceae bacterium]
MFKRKHFLFTLQKKDIFSTLQLSYPIVVGQIGLVLMGVTDTLMVGPLGASSLAASGLANAIFFLFAVIGIGVLSVVSPMTAATKSRGETEKCSLILSNSIQIALITGVLVFLALYMIGQVFYIFRQKSDVEALAISYLNIIGISAIPMFVFLAVKNFTDGLSFTKVAMIVTFVCVLLNVFFNWVLIYGKFGFPQLGLDGAGLATLFCRILMGLGMYGYALNSPRIVRFLPNFSLKNYKAAIFNKILKLGLPAGFQYVFEVGAFAGASVIIGWLGTHQLAAHQIAINLASITYMVASGFAAAGSIKVGDALGEKSQEKILKFGSAALILSGAFMILSCVVFICMNYFLVGLYIKDTSVINIAASLMIIAGFFQLSDGIQCVALGALRGLEDVNLPTIITFFAYWVVGLPLGYVMAFPMGLDVEGIWYGLSLGLAVSAIFLTVRFYILAGRKSFYDTSRVQQPKEVLDMI